MTNDEWRIVIRVESGELRVEFAVAHNDELRMTNYELTKKDSMPKVLLNFFQKIAVSKGGAFGARSNERNTIAVQEHFQKWIVRKHKRKPFEIKMIF